MSRAWYFVCLIPLVIGLAIAGLSLARLLDRIESMPRMVVPGDQAFTLPAGEHVVYAESQSVVGGVAYKNDRFSVRCGVEAAGGVPIELHSYDGKMKYSMGSYEGGAIFTFTTTAPGAVTLRCTTDDAKAVLAVGAGMGVAVLVAVLGALLGLASAIVTFFIIRKKRKRYRALVAARDGTP